jgi:hypothetical protein
MEQRCFMKLQEGEPFLQAGSDSRTRDSTGEHGRWREEEMEKKDKEENEQDTRCREGQAYQSFRTFRQGYGAPRTVCT